MTAPGEDLLRRQLIAAGRDRAELQTRLEAATTLINTQARLLTEAHQALTESRAERDDALTALADLIGYVPTDKGYAATGED